MATTSATINWRVAGRALNAGQLWANLSIPAAGARMSLHPNGTPDLMTNPQAFHLGATKAGAKLMAKPKFDDYFVDEFRAPIDTTIGDLELGISADLVGVTDMKLNEILSPGFGTYSDDASGGAATYEQLTFGTKPLVYTSVAHIFPSAHDPAKFVVWHLYSALNNGGIEFSSARKELGFNAANFKGYEITTRAIADSMGSLWKMK